MNKRCLPQTPPILVSTLILVGLAMPSLCLAQDPPTANQHLR